MKHHIKFYPVANGDQTLITTQTGLQVMVDCNIRQSSIGSTDPLIFDVRADLLKSIHKRDGIPYVDVFVLTHGDSDHCNGYKENFYQGNPKNYSDTDKKAELIIIDEMWFSPMIAEEHHNDDEQAYQQEAERRLALHRAKHEDKDLPGNRIKIVGYDGNKEYSDLNHLRIIPGSVINIFNNVSQDCFSLFIHAPFKEHLESAEKDRNSTSIVFQARFKENSWDSEFSGLAMFGGDSDHYSWEIIYDQTMKHGNNISEQALDWDILLAPHHCSWSFFNDRPQKENSTPKEKPLKILDHSRTGAWVISSSKKVVDDDNNPPHYAAKQEYIKKLESASKFLNTAIHPKESQPQPIIFEIDKSGVKKCDDDNSQNKKLDAALKVSQSAIITKPWCS